jgi:hypothetical protein
MLSLPLELVETGVNAQTVPTPGRNQTELYIPGALVASVSLGLMSTTSQSALLMATAILDSSNPVQDGTTLFGHQSLQYINGAKWRLTLEPEELAGD